MKESTNVVKVSVKNSGYNLPDQLLIAKTVTRTKVLNLRSVFYGVIKTHMRYGFYSACNFLGTGIIAFFRRALERKLSSWMTTTLIIICTETNYILYLRHSILFLDCMQTQKLSSVYCRQLVLSKTKRTRDTKQNQEVLTKKTKKQKTRQPFSDTPRTTYAKRNFLAPFFSHGSFYRARIVTFVPRCTRRVQCIKLEKMSQLLHRLVIISGFCWRVGGVADWEPGKNFV